MTIQEIFVKEKGEEALRKVKINLQIARSKDEPSYTTTKKAKSEILTQEEEAVPLGKVKKSLAV